MVAHITAGSKTRAMSQAEMAAFVASKESGGGEPTTEPGATPQLTSPDFTFAANAESIEPTESSSEYITWGAEDPTDASNNTVAARYSPDGNQFNGTIYEGARSEVKFDFPGLRAVQIIAKFRQYVPSTYSVNNADNHKSISFRSGPYGMTSANIAVNSECWPAVGGGAPSMYLAVDGNNHGHYYTDGDPILWDDNAGRWYDIVAVLELAPAPGQFGRYRLYRDGVLRLDSDDPNMEPPWQQPEPNVAIAYATRGNYIDHVRLCGWANAIDGSIPPFAEQMYFHFDDIEITANETFKTIVEPA